MSTEKLFQVGVKALIENKQKRVLLLKAPGWKKANTPDHWDIPGGRIQEAGTILETLQREIKEEIGVSKISVPKFFTSVISNHEFPIKTGQRVGLVLMIYELKNTRIQQN